jgi:ribosomal protein L37E
MMDRRKAFKEIRNLLDTECGPCGKSMNNKAYDQPDQICGSCPVYKKIRRFEQIKQKKKRNVQNQIDSILKKGMEMKLTEVAWLLENDVTNKKIWEAMDISNRNYFTILKRVDWDKVEQIEEKRYDEKVMEPRGIKQLIYFVDAST